MELPEFLKEMLEEIGKMNTEEKFVFLLECAKKLPLLPESEKIPENMLQGCASKAWVFMYVNENGKFFLSGDADAQIAKGILGFFAEIFSGQDISFVQNFDAIWLEKTGIFGNLSPSRANGAANAWKKIQNFLKTSG